MATQIRVGTQEFTPGKELHTPPAALRTASNWHGSGTVTPTARPRPPQTPANAGFRTRGKSQAERGGLYWLGTAHEQQMRFLLISICLKGTCAVRSKII